MNHLCQGWVHDILETEADVVCLLDPKLHIDRCNPGWDRFAAENGGTGVSSADVRGRYIFDFIPDVLVTFYEQKYSTALHSPGWTGFDYSCNSPEVFRVFHMSMHPVEGSYLLVVNSQLADQRSPLPARNSRVPESAYVSPDGVITMCAHCRRTRQEQQPRTWEWVPQFVRDPGRRASPGLCPMCVGYFYPSREALPH